MLVLWLTLKSAHLNKVYGCSIAIKVPMRHRHCWLLGKTAGA
jgi:hypothetical protein